VFGCDIDVPAVAWLRENYANIEATVNKNLPPLPYRDGQFDLLFGYSVFTHLSEAYQDEWLNELRRVTAPGAVLLLTTSGEAMWKHTLENSTCANLDQLGQMRGDLDTRGIIHWTGEGWEAFFPEFYHTTFHLPWYIKEHWGKWFEVVEVRESGAWVQDMVVLRRP